MVTGASGGMGQSLVELLIGSGARVIGLDHNEKRLRKIAEQLNGEYFRPVVVDIGNDGLETFLMDHLDDVSDLRGLVNLAGVSVGDSIDSLTDADWSRSFDVNVTAAMRLTRFCAPLMQKTGGSIVNVSSPVGFIGARKPSYSASKAALQGLTMSTARNLGSDNIRVNLLIPGTTITFMTEDWPENKRQAIAKESFLGRLCQPDEIARVIRFLLSSDSSYITGSIIDATAGIMFGH